MVCIVSPAAAAPTHQDVSEAIVAFNAGASAPLPLLDPDEVAQLGQGKVLRFVDRVGGDGTPRRALGIIWSAASRDQVWVACQDTHFSQSAAVVENRLSWRPPDEAEWYGIADLPRPFSDRHWVVAVRNNHALAAASGNRAWEHPWTTVPGGLARAREAVAAGRFGGMELAGFDAAVEMPANQGAWVAIALPDGSSLFAYHNAAVLGGNIPESLMLRYVHATLESTLRTIEERARTVVPGHYGPDHPPVIGGDGAPVAPFPRPAAAP